MTDSAAPRHGLVSGQRHLSKAALELQVARAAGGLIQLGVGQGDCVAHPDAQRHRHSSWRRWPQSGSAPTRCRSTGTSRPTRSPTSSATATPKVLVGACRPARGGRPCDPGRTQRDRRHDAARDRRGLRGRTEHLRPRQRTLDRLGYAGSRQQHAYDGPPVPPTQSMIYTSGTTGQPKGVRRNAADARQQEAAIDRAAPRALRLRPGVRTLVPGPLYHSAPNAFALRAVACDRSDRADAALRAGGLPGRDRAPPHHHAVHGADHVRAPAEAARGDAPALRPLLAAVRHARRRPLPARRQAADDRLVGADRVGVLRRHRDRRGQRHFGARRWLREPGSVGRAGRPARHSPFSATTAARCRRARSARSSARLDFYPDFTYHNQPAKRAEIERGGLITCGDMGYLDADGYLFLCDRKRDMVISGGVNIYPAEIEAVALCTMPGVKRLRGVRHPRCRVRRGADGRGRADATECELSIDGRARRIWRAPRRLQGAARASRSGTDLPREESRQDLQAPAARSLLGEGGTQDLTRRTARGSTTVRVSPPINAKLIANDRTLKYPPPAYYRPEGRYSSA